VEKNYYSLAMIHADKNKYKDILATSVEYLEQNGFEDLKADMEGYDTPKSFRKKGSDIKITPDIVGEKNGTTHYFDISLKSEKPNLLKSKWLFLNTLSAAKSRRFRLITTKGHFKFTNEMLRDINLTDKKLIKI
jgi:hypothetical protein